MSAHPPLLRCLAACVVAAVTLVPVSASATPVAPATPATPVVPLGPATAATESAALTKASVEHRAIEVSPLTTDRTRVVADPTSGQLVAQLNANPVRVQRDGAWVALDPSLSQVNGRLVPRAAAVDLSVTDGGADSLVSIADAGRSLSLAWTADAQLPTPVVQGDKAIYVDVRPGIDLVVQTDTYGFSQFLVVRDRAAAHDPLLQEFGLGVSAPGLSVSEVDGGIEARDPAGEVVFAAPPPQMWASSGGAPTTSAAETSAYATDAVVQGATASVGLEVTQDRISLRPDQTLLDDPSTTYPVVIDPSISRVQKNWAMVWSNGMHFWNPSDKAHTARVGYDGWSGQNKVSRVFYTFDTKALAGRSVSSATFTHKQVSSPQNDCSAKNAKPAVNLYRSGTISSSTRWPGPDTYGPPLDASTVLADYWGTCRNVTTQEWNATRGAEDAAKDGWESLTLRLSSDDENDRSGWRQYQDTDDYPVLSITYNTPPAVPGAVWIHGMQTYAGANFLSTTTPTLSVPVADPDKGDSVKGVFVVAPASSSATDRRKFFASIPVNSRGSGKTVEVNIPAGVMTNGVTYNVYARADDGRVQTAFGPPTRVTVDTVRPGAPALAGPRTLIAQGAKTAFTIDAPESDVTGYRFGFGTGTQTTIARPTGLSGKVSIQVVANQFGPSFFTAQSVDRAGNISGAVARVEFKVAGTKPSNRYHLDRSGADDRANTAPASSSNALVMPTTPAPTWSWGRDRFGPDGRQPLNCADTAFQTGPTLPGKSLSTSTAGAFNTSQSFTVGAWLKPADLSMTSAALAERYAVTMPVGGGAAFSLGYGRAVAAGKASWLYTLDNVTDATGRVGMGDGRSAAGGVTPGRWTHVVGVYDAAAAKATLYVDGRLVFTRTTTVRPSRGDRLSLGGGPYGSASLTWKGAVDEVTLFQGALDAKQVLELAKTHRTSAGC